LGSLDSDTRNNHVGISEVQQDYRWPFLRSLGISEWKGDKNDLPEGKIWHL
jgi:hypothetical protein